MTARDMFGDLLVQDPATTIRILREQLATANEKLLDALRREKAALDAAEKARELYLKRTAELNAEITRLGNVIGEMSVAREVACG